MRILAIANQKGGVGKTTTAVNVAAGLARTGRRTLLVDCDPQAHATKHFRAEPVGAALAAVLLSEAHVREVRQNLRDRLDLVPADRALTGVALHLAAEPGRDHLLKLALQSVEPEYDYVLLDCPPSLGLLTINALTAARWLWVPLQLEFFALDGLAELERTVRIVRDRLNGDLELGGIIACRAQRRRLAHEVVAAVQSRYGDLVCRTIIRENIRLAEASSHGVPVVEYDPDCHGAEDYTTLTEEVLQRVEKTGPGA